MWSMVYFYAFSVPNLVTGKPTVPIQSRPLFKFVRWVQDDGEDEGDGPILFSSAGGGDDWDTLAPGSSRILAGYLFVHHVF